MKKIDVIFPAYINAPMGPTGTLRRFLRNRDYMESRGYEFTVFTKDFLYSKTVDNPENHPHDFTKGLNIRTKLRNFFRNYSLLTIGFLIRNARESKKLVKAYLRLNRDADIVVFHETSCCYYYQKLRKNKKSKVVLFHHSNGNTEETWLKSYPKLEGTRFFQNYMEKMTETSANADRNVFISEDGMKNFGIINPSLDKAKFAMFHNGIDNMPIKGSDPISNHKYNFCCTGTVCERKGQYLIVEALNKVAPEIRNDIYIVVAGEGADLQNVKDKTRQYGLEANFNFLGYVPNKDIHQLLCRCNGFILMSNNEGLPISVIEAMRAGLGSIATNISGVPELVDDRNGIIIEPEANQLAEVFKNIDKYDWKIFGENARKRFENEFTFEQMMKSYCDVMDGFNDEKKRL